MCQAIENRVSGAIYHVMCRGNARQHIIHEVSVVNIIDAKSADSDQLI